MKRTESVTKDKCHVYHSLLGLTLDLVFGA